MFEDPAAADTPAGAGFIQMICFPAATTAGASSAMNEIASTVPEDGTVETAILIAVASTTFMSTRAEN
ncbi:hypothetical protein BOX15_Mlig002326g1 [Macrostomum lignano]|uniref:Uncharacterized protein n=1 Tax=Macrostomum lignano TaxID=282301 RepID=A0A267G4X4_9PLAT|nr:hypothetical protein BOX15_Mlig002326g1 [Macrostomum lignano]